MRFLSISVIFISLSIIQDFHQIDASIQQIFKKVEQEVEELIDRQEYESIDGMVEDSKVGIKYFDYIEDTTVNPSKVTTTTFRPENGKPGNDMSRDGTRSEPDGAAAEEKGVEEGGGGGGAMIYVAIVIVVVIVIIVGVVGLYIYSRKTKSSTNRNIKKKVKRSTSRESLSSIETVASDTGKPIHSKPSKTAVAAPAVSSNSSKSAPKSSSSKTKK